MSWVVDKLRAFALFIRKRSYHPTTPLSDDSDEEFEYYDHALAAKELEKKYGANEIHLANLKALEFDSLKTIGSGGFSIVKKGFSKAHKQEIAVKIIILDEKDNQSYVKKYLTNEVSLWRELSVDKHPNILNLIDAIDIGNIMYIMTEVASRGDLHERLLISPMTEAKAKTTFRQLSNAVAYCHSKGLAHRDIKPQNLLLDNNDQVKLADFSFITNMNPVACQRCGTPAMLAPEQVGSGYYNPFKTDIWQMGVTLYLMITGRVPYKNCRKEKLEEDIKQAKNAHRGVPFPPRKMFSKNCKDLIADMLAVDFTMRCDIEHVQNSPWLNDS